MKAVHLLMLVLTFSSVAIAHSSKNKAKKSYDSSKMPRFAASPSSPECLACTSVVAALDFAITSSLGIDQAMKIANDFCVGLNMIEITAICPGIIKTFAPTVFPILVEIGFQPHQVCIDIGFCDPKNVTTIEKPIPKKRRAPILKEIAAPSDDVTAGTILHISDIHWDDFYATGSVVYCNEPLCCRSYSVPVNNSTVGALAKKWGEHDNCDIPLILLEALLESAAQRKPSMVIITGDNTPHDIWNQTRQLTIERIKKVSDVVSKHFPTTPIISSMGNHDSYPVDQFSRKKKDSAHYDDFEWLLKGVTESWGPWIQSAAWNASDAKQAIKTLRNYGFYSVSPKKGLRVIALNTFWADEYNFYNLLAEKQGDYQFSWLEKTLSNSKKIGEKVILTGHIPPNNAPRASLSNYIANYTAMITKYSSIILGQLYGHTHKDQFNLQHDKGQDKPATGMVYIMSSVTAFGQNPGYRLMKYNKNFELLDYDHYLVQLNAVNQTVGPVWEKTYSPRADYRMNDLSPHSWELLANRMETNNTLFQDWYYNCHTRSKAWGSCDDNCKTQTLCGITNNC